MSRSRVPGGLFIRPNRWRLISLMTDCSRVVNSSVSICPKVRVRIEVQQLLLSCSVFSGIEERSAKSCCDTRL